MAWGWACGRWAGGQVQLNGYNRYIHEVTLELPIKVPGGGRGGGEGGEIQLYRQERIMV